MENQNHGLVYEKKTGLCLPNIYRAMFSITKKV